MNKEPTPMREIHEIQEKLFEEQKHLTDEKKLTSLHKEVEEAEKKYGFSLKKGIFAK